VTTASGSLNMRKTASKSAEVIAKIPQGATVTVLMEADGWWRVQYKNSTAIFSGNIWKLPHIPDTDGTARTDQDETETGFKTVSFFHTSFLQNAFP